jgi:hypothetical protein
MNIDTIGSRHSSLLAIMSAGASRVMSEEELMKVVAKRMPSYYQENDCHQLIHDFYSKYGDSSKPFSRDVIRVNALAEQAAKSLLAGDYKSPEHIRDCKSPERLTGDFMGQMAGNANHTVQSSNLKVQSEDEDYPDPPPMPKKLPKLVELLISKTPEIYQPAVAHAIFPSLATHLWRTRFRYIDNVEHEATLMTCLLAGTGAGKSCVQKPIDFIMEDIRKRDAENLKREKEWKDEMMRKGANKDKRKRPENLIIQEIDADMTNPAFVMRTAEAKEHFLYTSLNEIDQFDALKGIGNQQFRIMCLAFDPGNLYGQTRVGTQSVTERVTIRFNWNASTTIHKGIRYFKRVLTDGPVSRINFCTIPERDIGEDIPVYGTYDDEFRNSLKPYIDNLCMASGLVECKEAFQLAEVLKDENAEFSRLRDAENLKREKEWKDEMMRKGANKDKRKRPENLIIQEIDADMTNPAFVMRTAEAKEHFLYTSLNEIDQFDALKGIGNQQFRIMCLAFDPGNLYGQTRVGTQSVTERVTIRFNWNASTTIHKGIRYFKRVLTDGPVSRINFCTIPERDIGEDIPVYGTYDDEFRNSLKPYIDNLCMASGLVECKEAFQLAEVLKDENAEFSRLSQDRVYENLSFRANVIGYLKACVLYVANGYQWEPEIEDFIRWSERYDLYCKMRFFGDAIKKAERDGDQESKKGPASILAFLPDKFSYQQVESLRLKNDMNAKGTAKMLRNWLHRGYIEKEESDSVTQKLSDSVYFKTHY